MPDESIGSNIAKAREIVGHSQSSLAKKSGVSQSAISQIEKGDRNPSFTILLRIKRALGVEWAGLLRGIE